MNKGEVKIYQSPDGNTQLDVKLEGETVWINRQQMAELFDRDVKTISKHINNALQEELKEIPVVAKFATTASDGKTYQVEYYNLDMVLSVGYRVKSNRGIQFRIWAIQVLKEYLVKGYAVNERIKENYISIKELSYPFYDCCLEGQSRNTVFRQFVGLRIKVFLNKRKVGGIAKGTVYFQ